MIENNIIEDKLSHINKTEPLWYAYAESHYTLNDCNINNNVVNIESNIKSNVNIKSDINIKSNINIKTEKINDIDKTQKYWYCYAESHYSTTKNKNN